MDNNFFVFENENGEQYNLKVTSKFNYNNEVIAVCEDTKEDDKIYLFKIIDSEDGDTLVSIDDQNELKELEVEFNRIVNENIQ